MPTHRAFARSIGFLALLSVPTASLADIDMTGDWTYECHDTSEFLGPMINTYSDTIAQTGADLQWGIGGSGTIDAGTGVFDALGPPMPPFYLQRTFEGTVSPDGNRFEGVCNSGSPLRGIRDGIAVCGDAEREPGEQCDHGETNGLDGCCDVNCMLIDPDEDSICSDIDTCPDDYDPENGNGCGGVPAFETTRLAVREDRQLISFRGLLRGSSATYIEEVNDLVFRESTLADPYRHDFGDLVCTRRNARRLACESVDGTKKVKLATSATGTKITGKLLQVGDVPSFLDAPVIIEFSDQHGTTHSSTIEDCTRGC